MIALLLCVIITITGKVASEGCHFGYEGDHGVDHWGEDYNECLGKHQSPIDIDSEHVTRVSLSPLIMNGFDATRAATLSNNGHTAMMTIDCDTKPTISGGPLNGVYTFAQLHYHWGSNDTVGSEDQINDKRYPLEMHLVFYKEDYLDVNSAMGHSDGLCVLACLFEIQENDNDNYNSFVKTLKQIIQSNTASKINNPPALFDLMPHTLSTYYTYNGSLTTPPCSEVVTWIEFDNTIKISHDQLQAFRSLTDSDSQILINNFRAVQPLGDREVQYNVADISEKSLLQQMRRVLCKVTDKILYIFNLLVSLI